jgi:diguanylate cyclase (GGDEF)-like protein
MDFSPMTPADCKVLVVDDDPVMLHILSLWLQKAGYPVRLASDGRQALAAIEADCPHFLVTDWEMPNLNGLELCRRVRELGLPHYVYILFLTVRSAQEEIIAGLENGADDFLTKPVECGELLARIRAGSRVLELERRLSRMASTDPLTGLTTQRAFYDLLEKEWQRARRFALPLSCVMMDLDFFKRINDIHGHPAGDAALKAVAGLLSDNCRGSDTVCRYGGEEFCILLPQTGEPEAALWAERIRAHLAALVIRSGDKHIRLTASFGAAQRHDDTQTSEELVDLADQALLCAKQSGRDRVVRYESLGEADELTLQDDNTHGKLFSGILARHVMTPLVVCLREDETVGQAAEFFLRSRINSAPVVDAAGKLSGILSEKDLMAAMVSLDCWQQPVRQFMKPNVICYEENTPIRTIYEFLCRVSIRRVVIANEGRPGGTISRGTLLRWFRNLVTSKGLLENAETSQPRDLDPHHSKQRLAETARALAQQASDLQRRFQEDAEDLVPYVVGGATGMQELVNDLLAYSRYADGSAALAAVQSMVVEGGYVD